MIRKIARLILASPYEAMGKVYIVFIERVCVLLLTPPSTRLASWSFHEGLAEAWLVGGCGVDVCGLCVVVCVCMDGVVCLHMCVRASACGCVIVFVCVLVFVYCSPV